MIEKILNRVGNVDVPGFFITIDFISVSTDMPVGIEEFICRKTEIIRQGATGRKFVFKENGWRMIFTFYPTDKIVDEKYAMKNKVIKGKSVR